MKYIYKQTKFVSKQQLYQMSSMDVQWGYDIYIYNGIIMRFQWVYNNLTIAVQCIY
jgi:hypothetical protein